MARANDASYRRFKRLLARVLPEGYVVRDAKYLLYRVPLQPDLSIAIQDARKPTRPYIFETDLSIWQLRRDGSEVPRVVFEMKPGVSSHDVITYAAKARQHKHLYPWLRYGLVSMRSRELPERVFTHREGLDFIFCPKGLTPRQRVLWARDLVEAELAASEILERVNFGKMRGKRLVREAPQVR